MLKEVYFLDFYGLNLKIKIDIPVYHKKTKKRTIECCLFCVSSMYILQSLCGFHIFAYTGLN